MCREKAIIEKIEENETHVVVIIAVPSDPRKRPKKPATELPSRGKKTISRYIRSSVFIKPKKQTMKERPVIEKGATRLMTLRGERSEDEESMC